MSLYAYIDSKDDLLELTHDAVVQETPVGEVPSDWREALRMLARHNRAAALRHPWLLATRDTGCPIGPASLKHMDESAAAVRGLNAESAVRRALILAVGTFTFGHVMAELSGGIRRRATEAVDAARREATTEYVQTQIDAGKLPHLACGDTCRHRFPRVAVQRRFRGELRTRPRPAACRRRRVARAIGVRSRGYSTGTSFACPPRRQTARIIFDSPSARCSRADHRAPR